MTEISAILIFLAGGIIGFLICRIALGTKPTAAQQQKLDDSKSELEHYKSQVNNHFTNSAELMQQVASSYQALYTHMAGQSQDLLSDSDTSPFPLLKTPPEKQHSAPEMAEEKVQETVAETTTDTEQTNSTEESKETTPNTAQTDDTEENKNTAVKEATDDTTRHVVDTDATKETNEDGKKTKNQAP